MVESEISRENDRTNLLVTEEGLPYERQEEK
jgi:hypothetical protein